MQALDQVLGSSGIDPTSLGAHFGLDPDQARSAVGSLVPAVIAGLHRQAEAGDPSGVAGAAAGIQQPDTQAGNDMLGRIFGSKDVSRQVADHASAQSGVPSTVLKAMLPIIAAGLSRHVAVNGGQAGGLGGMLASALGGGAGSIGGLGDLLGGSSNPLGAILGSLHR